MSKPIAIAFCAALHLCFANTGAFAAMLSILDQQNESLATQSAVGTTVSIRERFRLHESLQTFVVGVTGTLVRVEVLVDPWSGSTYFPLHIEVQSTDELGRPYADVAALGSGDTGFGDQDETQWLSVEFRGPGISVVAGEVLALALSSIDDDGYRWYGSEGDQYSDGSVFYRYNYPATNPPWEPSMSADFDQSFRTYIIPAIPEPSAAILALVGVCLAAIASHGRSQR